MERLLVAKPGTPEAKTNYYRPFSSGYKPQFPNREIFHCDKRLSNQLKLSPVRLQAKLKVSHPEDPYEQEADRVADTVMKIPAPSFSSIEFSKIPIFPDQVQRKFPDSCTEESGFNSSGPFAGSIMDPLRTAENQTIQSLIKSRVLQTKLRIGQPNDVYEQEADRVADQVMRMPNPVIQRKCTKCDEDEEKVLRVKELPGHRSVTHDQDVPPIVHEVLRSPGQPLDQVTRAFMEPRFGCDFSSVQVHTGAAAEQSARDVNAHAYTVGNNIVFGMGGFTPGTHEGRRLIAHELTHVVQQWDSTSERTSPEDMSAQTGPRKQKARRETKIKQVSSLSHPVMVHRPLVTPAQTAQRLYRATFSVGSATVQIDYGNVVGIPAIGYKNAIKVLFENWTGSPASTIHTNLTTLTQDQKRWLLFALDVLVNNTTSAHSGLNREDAVKRLINHAPSSTTRPLGITSFDFEREVMRVSGWFEVALAAQLTVPTGNTLTTIGELYNPPPGPAAPPSGALDAIRLQKELPPALTNMLKKIDPANWTATGTQQLSDLQNIGDLIQSEARSIFSPYADTAINNVYSRGWHYSSNLFSVTAMPPTKDLRISYLLNRAEMVGRLNLSGGSIFSNVNYDSSRSADRVELLKIVTAKESDPTIQNIVNRLLQHTGRTSGPVTARSVGIPTEFNLETQTECESRWKTISTLSHELVHVLVHPSFPTSASSIRFGQIVLEGFTEVLGNQLYNKQIRPKAASNPQFKAQMESGIAGAPCPVPTEKSIGYQQAGASAEQIRGLVGNDNFRAAYFLGAIHLVGL